MGHMDPAFRAKPIPSPLPNPKSSFGGPAYIAVDHMDPATWPNPFTPSKTKDLLRGARLADSEIAKTTEYKPLPFGEWLAVLPTPGGTARIR